MISDRSGLRRLQDRLSGALEAADGAARFREDAWERPTTGSALAGGGRTRVLREGAAFEFFSSRATGWRPLAGERSAG